LDLWDTIVSFEYTLWIGCAVFYILDHIKLLTPQELFYEETLLGAWSLRVNKVPFTIFNKELYVLNPFLPWLCAFKAKWGQDICPSGRVVRLEHHDFLTFLKSCTPLRLVSLCSFIGLFVLGPYLTATRGLIYAVITVVLLNVLLQVLSISALWFYGKALKVSKWKSVLLAFEAFICPPYTACLLKRISLNYIIACDGLIVAKALRRFTNFPVALEHVANRIQERSQVGSLPEDQVLLADRYLEKLRPS
jgi:hypothetical protein